MLAVGLALVTAVVALDSVVVSAYLASFRLLTILPDNTTDEETATIGFTVPTVVADAAVRGRLFPCSLRLFGRTSLF